MITQESVKKIGFYETMYNYFILDLNDWSYISVNFWNSNFVVEISVSKHGLVANIETISQLKQLIKLLKK